jgi:exodeoxyribonuclease V alpha subunit
LITSIRIRGRAGGAIFAGVTPQQARYVVKCDYKVLPNSASVDKGQQWSVTGTLGTWNDETQITAQTATMLRPSGRNVVEWIAGSKHCAGIGLVKARDLYDRFGLSLIDHISNWDIDTLGELVTEHAAYLLCEAFDQYKVAADLQWLDQIGIPRTVGAKVLEFYKETKPRRTEGEARAKVEANPYMLISFAERWQIVDEIARTRFGIAANDPRRLEAALEDTLYSILGNNHTCISIYKAKSGLYYRLRDAQLVMETLALTKPSTQYLRFGDYLQPSGMYLIEKYVADRLKQMAAGEKANQRSLLALVTEQWSDMLAENEIAAYEREEGLTLTTEQREAVITAATNNLTLILGGAGTGKTTVLKAVYRVLESYDSHVQIHQIALAGRAAQRMKEVTGRDSMTIAAFIRALENGSKQVGPSTIGHLE